MAEVEEGGLLPHLIELRSRLLKSIAALVVVFLVLCIYPGPNEIYDLLAHPLIASLPAGDRMISLGVITPFIVPLKTTLFAAIVISMPYILYQAWAFIAPGLYRREKSLALPLMVGSYTLFIVGMCFCYFFVFRLVFRFIISVAPDSIQFAPDIEAYIDFVTTMFLAFGITFEVPVVVILLVFSGIASVEKLKQARSYVIVGSFIVAAILTPPDIISQVLMAVPLILLFEIGLRVAMFYSRDSKTISKSSE